MFSKKLRCCFLFLILLGLAVQLFGAGEVTTENFPRALKKMAGHEHRRWSVHDGNNVVTVFSNYGCIGNWFDDSNRLQSGIFPKGSGHSYFAEFFPFVGGRVLDANGQWRTIFSDGAGSATDMAPGNEYQYGFEPVPGYMDESADYIAMYNGQGSEDNDGPDGISAHLGSTDDDGKPDSWPDVWPNRPDWVNPATGIPYWNGQYGAYNRATQESYFRMNDYINDEWSFWPDPADSSKRGLALEVEVRGYQWADPEAEDIIIFTYWITNRGKTTYDKVVFGMYGDADIGEGSPYNKDDLSEFDKEQDICYQWDNDGWSASDGGYKTGYFGWKFLESPSDPRNAKDDDEDGIPGIDGNPWDESQEDLFDNDGDWDPLIDDIGADGKGTGHPDYPGPDPDGTEGNGVPDRGEPNFEYTDNDESDQIGLTSFMSSGWVSGGGTIDMSNDSKMWMQTVPGTFAKPAAKLDIIMHYGSGYFQLPPAPDPDARRKFAVSMVMGVDRDDLVRNATTMQQIYNNDYNFAAVPEKPNVSVVPADRKVTVYWDKKSEYSRDPIYGYDFEGYLIYRSTDAGFLDSYIGTDTYGNDSFNKPIAQFDKIDGLEGPHPVGRDGIQFNIGEDNGLQYVFVDSGQTWMGPVENGQTYYYAVCAYDKGYYDDFYDRGLVELPNLLPKAPAICEKNIQVAASGEVIALDVNTVQVVPNIPAAGYIDAPVLGTDNGNVDRVSGEGTGRIVVEALDPIKVQAGAEYEVSFDENGTYDIPGITEVFVDTTFSIKDLRYFTQSVKVDTEWTMLRKQDIDSMSVTLSIDGTEYVSGIDFEIGYEIGNIRAVPTGNLPYGQGQFAEISYQYFVIKNSPYVNSETINGHFDGYRITVFNDTLKASQSRSHWLSGDLQQHYLAQYGFIGANDPIPAGNQPPTNYNYQVSYYTNQGVRVPADYHLVVYDEVVTQSVNRKMANFRLFNASTGDTSAFVFFDTDKDSLLSSGDYLTPTMVVNRRTRGTWQMKFTAPRDSIVLIDSLDARGFVVTDKEGDAYKIAIDTIYVDKVKPRGGDIFYLAVDKPFAGSDKFTFKAQPPSVDYETAQSENELEKIAVVPNPYVVTASWEPQHFYSSGRGIRKVDFIHLPPQCTIRVFTMRGHLVDTIEHDSLINDGSESWDLLSKDGMEIAYGVYLFHVETPSGDSSVGKFAVIK